VTTAIVDIGTLITQSPEIRNGQPRIAGKGVSVKRIAGWYKMGLSAEEIVTEVGHLSLAQVYAALAYYHANQDELDAAIEAGEHESAEIEKQHHRGTGAKLKSRTEQ